MGPIVNTGNERHIGKGKKIRAQRQLTQSRLFDVCFVVASQPSQHAIKKSLSKIGREQDPGSSRRRQMTKEAFEQSWVTEFRNMGSGETERILRRVYVSSKQPPEVLNEDRDVEPWLIATSLTLFATMAEFYLKYTCTPDEQWWEEMENAEDDPDPECARKFSETFSDASKAKKTDCRVRAFCKMSNWALNKLKSAQEVANYGRSILKIRRLMPIQAMKVEVKHGFGTRWGHSIGGLGLYGLSLRSDSADLSRSHTGIVKERRRQEELEIAKSELASAAVPILKRGLSDGRDQYFSENAREAGFGEGTMDNVGRLVHAWNSMSKDEKQEWTEKAQLRAVEVYQQSKEKLEKKVQKLRSKTSEGSGAETELTFWEQVMTTVRAQYVKNAENKYFEPERFVSEQEFQKKFAQAHHVDPEVLEGVVPTLTRARTEPNKCVKVIHACCLAANEMSSRDPSRGKAKSILLGSLPSDGAEAESEEILNVVSEFGDAILWVDADSTDDIEDDLPPFAWFVCYLVINPQVLVCVRFRRQSGGVYVLGRDDGRSWWTSVDDAGELTGRAVRIFGCSAKWESNGRGRGGRIQLDPVYVTDVQEGLLEIVKEKKPKIHKFKVLNKDQGESASGDRKKPEVKTDVTKAQDFRILIF